MKLKYIQINFILNLFKDIVTVPSSNKLSPVKPVEYMQKIDQNPIFNVYTETKQSSVEFYA